MTGCCLLAGIRSGRSGVAVVGVRSSVVPRSGVVTARAFLAGLCAVGAVAADEPLLIAVPGQDWALAVAVRQVEFGPPETSPDGTRIWVDGDGVEEPGFTITVIVHETPGAGTAEDCRAVALERLARRGHEPTLTLRGGMALAEYRLDQYRGVPVRQQRLDAFLFRDGYCIDVGLSMLDFKSKHRNLFDATLRSIRFVDPPPEPPDGGG